MMDLEMVKVQLGKFKRELRDIADSLQFYYFENKGKTVCRMAGKDFDGKSFDTIFILGEGPSPAIRIGNQVEEILKKLMEVRFEKTKGVSK